MHGQVGSRKNGYPIHHTLLLNQKLAVAVWKIDNNQGEYLRQQQQQVHLESNSSLNKHFMHKYIYCFLLTTDFLLEVDILKIGMCSFPQNDFLAQCQAPCHSVNVRLSFCLMMRLFFTYYQCQCIKRLKVENQFTLCVTQYLGESCLRSFKHGVLY